MRIRVYIPISLILAFSILLHSRILESGAPVINNYEPEQYKAGPQNWVAIQDYRGIMYFGNSNGILELEKCKTAEKLTNTDFYGLIAVLLRQF